MIQLLLIIAFIVCVVIFNKTCIECRRKKFRIVEYIEVNSRTLYRIEQLRGRGPFKWWSDVESLQETYETAEDAYKNLTTVLERIK